MFNNLRMLAFVRRGVRALESLAESHKELADSARARRLQREARAARKPKPLEMGTMDLAEAEKRYRKMHPALDEPEDAA